MTRGTDQLEVAAVLYTYAWTLDSGDWSGLAGTFSANAGMDFLAGGLVQGSGEIVQTLRGIVGPLDRTQHVVDNMRVDFEGDDRASVTCYYAAHHVLASVAREPFTVGGIYRATVVRSRAEDWRISMITPEVVWSRGDPAVLGLDADFGSRPSHQE